MSTATQSFPPSPPIVVQTKPGTDIWNFENLWAQGIYSCCEDTNLCCRACWCCPCTMHEIYQRVDENTLDCCWPMTLWPLRTKVRTLFRIQGSLCGDCMAVYCCPCCALVQMHREITNQGL